MRNRTMHTISNGPKIERRKQRDVSHWYRLTMTPLASFVSCQSQEVKAQEHNQEDKHESKWEEKKKNKLKRVVDIV